jgi:hypothetical protein
MSSKKSPRSERWVRNYRVVATSRPPKKSLDTPDPKRA